MPCQLYGIVMTLVKKTDHEAVEHKCLLICLVGCKLG